MKQLTAIDPATGEVATLSQLSARYKIKLGTLHWRHKEGRRGHELVEPLNQKRGSRIGKGLATRREAITHNRAELIQSARANPLTRPFTQINQEKSQ